ncbi:uncharacterized protein LOC108110068 [Drosophila eugracilis]|uniref:uncharacterized protein LOC108110068 n=1 Tax=Drosophila eugracilis TaxID=29029 RepID=UPI0007E6B98D|nr:uncharacterized protein LOC108110068 [Drosophila eugracilis]
MQQQRVSCWCSLLFIVLANAIWQVSLGITTKDRRSQCLLPRLIGQTNCSPCAELYVFNRNSGYRRCEHVNGRCFQFSTVFTTARMCESTCQPFILRPTLHEKTTPVPLILEPFMDSDEESL